MVVGGVDTVQHIVQADLALGGLLPGLPVKHSVLKVPALDLFQVEQGGTVHKVHSLQSFLHLHFCLDSLLHRLFHSLFHTQGGRPVLDALPDHIHMPGIGHLGKGLVDVRHRVRGGQQRPRLFVRQFQRLDLHQDVLPHRILYGVV